jgi:hypothetical protein
VATFANAAGGLTTDKFRTSVDLLSAWRSQGCSSRFRPLQLSQGCVDRSGERSSRFASCGIGPSHARPRLPAPLLKRRATTTLMQRGSVPRSIERQWKGARA